MLQCKGIEARIGRFVLDAEWQVPQGARVAIVGPSGAGKSTLFSVIAGFCVPIRGHVLWNGQQMPKMPADRPMSVLFQDNNLFPHLSAFQNIALGISPALQLTQHEIAQVYDSLQKVGLQELAQRKPAEMSGGQQARVALARALVRRKPLLLLDEPFVGLGPGLANEMISLVRELVTEIGATLLFVTHSPNHIRALANTVIVVSDGHTMPPMDMGSLFENPPQCLEGYF